MKRHLHLFLFILFSIFHGIIFAQTERLKTAQKQVILTNSDNAQLSVDKSNSKIITEEKKKKADPPLNSKKSDYNSSAKMVTLKQPDQQRKPKVIAEVIETKSIVDDQKQATIEVRPDVNVTYTKEEPIASTNNSVSEVKKVKVQKSINYQPKTVKEDIHPITNYTNSGISSNKKIYLQQEADDLQAEINQNANNPAYDLIAKQKQLDDIKKLIQQ